MTTGSVAVCYRADERPSYGAGGELNSTGACGAVTPVRSAAPLTPRGFRSAV
jgi:hypothetical protein